MSQRLRIVAFIQARMASTRLPGKVLADLRGEPLLARVVQRLEACREIDDIVVLTSVNSADDAIQKLGRARGWKVFRGDERDVLDRFYRANEVTEADAIVRITADCPLLAPDVAAEVVREFRTGRYDYVCNTICPSFPDGLDVEVFSAAALDRAWREAKNPAEREHVTPYIRNSKFFKIGSVSQARDFSAMRWTVDTPADLDWVREVYKKLAEGDGTLTFEATLKIAEQIAPRGDRHLRNEGYYRSLAQEPPVPARNHKLERSRELLARARKVIPTASQTFSKCPTQFIQSTAPNFIARGAGSHVWDVDGNEFIDYPMALGPIILGHNDPDVTAAVVEEMSNGIAFSLPHALEVEVAEMLVEMIPCAEMVRFGKNGSDVTAGAVRAARAFTGREHIACCGYHGWQDWYIGTTTRNGGVPKAVQELTHPFDYNNLESLERLFAKFPGQIAAVIMEPIGVIEPRANFLPGVAALAKKNGALLIFDEIVTGFRVALGGAQEFFGVTPDLAAFGKAMGNGFPIAAVVGRRDVMEIFDEIFFSFTFGGETAALAAARATMKKLRDAKVIEHIWSKGRQLTDGIRFLANEFGLAENVEVLGQAPRTVFRFKDQAGQESLLVKSYFQQECLRRGILFSGGQNICFAHGDAEIDYTLRVYRTVMEMLRDAFKKGDLASRLEAPMIQPVFRRA